MSTIIYVDPTTLECRVRHAIRYLEANKRPANAHEIRAFRGLLEDIGELPTDLSRRDCDDWHAMEIRLRELLFPDGVVTASRRDGSSKRRPCKACRARREKHEQKMKQQRKAQAAKEAALAKLWGKLLREDEPQTEPQTEPQKMESAV